MSSTKQIWVRVLAALLLCLYASSAFASNYTLYRCRMDGVIRKACCCEKAHDASPSHEISSESCCDISHVERQVPRSIESKRVELATAKIAVRAIDPIELFFIPAVARPAREPELRPQGPPILLVKCVLLV